MGFGKEKTTYYLDVCRETGKLQHKPAGRETYHKYDYVEGNFTGLWTRLKTSKNGNEYMLLMIRLEDSNGIYILSLFKDSSIARNIINSIATLGSPFNAHLWIKTYRGEDYESPDGKVYPNYKIVVQSNKKRLEWLLRPEHIKKDEAERDDQFARMFDKIRKKMNDASTYTEDYELTADEENSMISDDVPF